LPTEDDRRLAPRKSFSHSFQLERSRLFTGETSQVYEIGQGIDISPTGMGIKADTPLLSKETVRIYLPVQAVDIPLPVFAEVRWVTAHQHYYRAGLLFMR
jgi:PilZ domain